MPTVHNLLGYLYLTQGESRRRPIPELQTTVQLDSEQPGMRETILGNALRQTNQYDAAAVQYQYVLDTPRPRRPGPSAGQVQSGDCSWGRPARTDEALALFT